MLKIGNMINLKQEKQTREGLRVWLEKALNLAKLLNLVTKKVYEHFWFLNSLFI